MLFPLSVAALGCPVAVVALGLLDHYQRAAAAVLRLDAAAIGYGAAAVLWLVRAQLSGLQERLSAALQASQCTNLVPPQGCGVPWGLLAAVAAPAPACMVVMSQ